VVFSLIALCLGCSRSGSPAHTSGLVPTGTPDRVNVALARERLPPARVSLVDLVQANLRARRARVGWLKRAEMSDHDSRMSPPQLAKVSLRGVRGGDKSEWSGDPLSSTRKSVPTRCTRWGQIRVERRPPLRNSQKCPYAVGTNPSGAETPSPQLAKVSLRGVRGGDKSEWSGDPLSATRKSVPTRWGQIRVERRPPLRNSQSVPTRWGQIRVERRPPLGGSQRVLDRIGPEMMNAGGAFDPCSRRDVRHSIFGHTPGRDKNPNGAETPSPQLANEHPRRVWCEWCALSRDRES
jgi:hypothetical protein